MKEALLKTELEAKLFKAGKVRDVYDLGDKLLMVATDRISAFDRVMQNGIPDKGKILTGISVYWFGRLKDIVPNHLISADVKDFPEPFKGDVETLRGRAMFVMKTTPIEVECVARGYLAGSGWREYRETGEVCGVKLPIGLHEADRLPEPIFTPAIKISEAGEHDINVSEDIVREKVGDEIVGQLKDYSIKMYSFAHDEMEKKGVILADTKFEFGTLDGRMTHIDEALTPDSSRFWPADGYEPGGSQPSYDKQFVRDFLEESGWNKEPPAPELPPDVVKGTREKYLEIFRIITGVELEEWENNPGIFSG